MSDEREARLALTDLGLALEPILLVARAHVLDVYPLLDERPPWIETYDDPANDPECRADEILTALTRLRTALRRYRELTRSR